MTDPRRAVLDLDRAERLVRDLIGAVSTRRIYARTHARSEESLQKLLGSVEAYFEAHGGSAAIRLTPQPGMLLYNGVPLETGGHTGQIAGLLEERNCGGILFSAAIRREALEYLLGWLTSRELRPPPSALPGVQFLAKSKAREEAPPVSLFPGLLPAGIEKACKLHATAEKALDQVMREARLGRQIDLGEVLQVAEWTTDATLEHGTQVVAPAQMRQHDDYTFRHSVNVFFVATALLQPLARSREELAIYAQAALLHDVGKSRIPHEILYKKERLTDDEFAIMRRHAEYGAEILASCRGLNPIAAHVAYCHHMRDGDHGYPRSSLGLAPGPVAAIVQVADMFEALTSHRPYQQSRLTVEEAVKTILETPGMESRRPAVGLLLHRLSCAPPGSQVVLDSGERAFVLQVNPGAPRAPFVRVVADAEGDDLSTPYDLDLSAPGALRKVTRVILKPGQERATATSTA
ncbi:MAG: HD-GYP domain-containing protein [Planctomycetaceae bacterium]